MGKSFLCNVTVLQDQNRYKRCSNTRNCSNAATRNVSISKGDGAFVDGDYSCDNFECQTHVKNALERKHE